MPRSVMGKGLKPLDALKSALADRQAKANKIVADTGQKWVKRGVLEQQRKDAYLEDKRQAEEKAQAEEDARTEQFVEHINRNRKEDVGGEADNDDQQLIDEQLLNDDNAEPPVGMSETMDTLRELAQPITLFGETPMMRYRRLYLLQKEMSEGKAHPDEILLDQVHIGQQQALVDAQAEPTFIGGGGGAAAQEDEEEDEAEGNEGAQDDGEDKGDSEDEAENKGDSEDEAEVPNQVAPNAGVEEKDKVMGVEDNDKDLWGGRELSIDLMDRCDKIRTWVRKVIKEWEKELASRDPEVKLKPPHRTEMNQHRQCRRDVKPLQKRLRIYSLEDFKLTKIYEIVDNADRREYRQSAEYYLDLTIGKAAWPVGIGCGGSMLMEDAIPLHDKFNRMDNVKDIAWVLNDEVTRKYVQALKRLITVAQRYWPPEDISKGST